MDLYELLGEELADNDMTITATADYGTPLVSLHRLGLDRVETKIRADERAKVVSEIAQMARDNASAGRPTRAAWAEQIAERIKKGAPS